MGKKLLLTVAAMLSWGWAAAQGIEFRDIPFDEALRQARQEGRPVFIDCYTVWCGPCKLMAENVFTLPAAGEYFNARFVCVKIDMEKGEGVELAKRFGVDIFPTFLVVNHNGREMHRVFGGGELNDFIARVDVGLRAKKPFETLARKYEKGRLGKKDMTDYWLLLRAAGKTVEGRQVGAKLLGMLGGDDKLLSVYWPLLRERANSPMSADMDFILTNRHALEHNNGKETVDKFIYDIFAGAITEENADAMMIKIGTLEGNSKVQLLYLASLAQARERNDAAGYIAVMEENYLVVPTGMTIDAFTGGESLFRKEDYRRLQTMAEELSERLADDAQNDITARNLKHRFDNMASRYRRMGHDGVYWEQFDTVDEALARAMAEEYKPVFLYLYTGVPDTVFEREDIGDLLNRHFINVMFDATENPDITARFDTVPIPAMLIIGSNGILQHVLNGSGNLFECLGKITKR